ncbi:hypothetical protein [Legionella oakridgensis]|uniref:Uncharacterized protein n=2 Tax=Legionella oakridgensis TaxID=29423 RepID=W0BD00_9GAMM|nr:hypothetical protein [Legionella oakridgensis]AHE68398.1 hypothetical protein Loa_02870 [Legionella oakridgensis ATCC 33761 = DSM 21215]KTD38445.1 hypothetical protein Loak_1390 [Legionella oakridgensis]STY21337.1 Uncharacterised protein [Legionella longbeachae]
MSSNEEAIKRHFEEDRLEKKRRHYIEPYSTSTAAGSADVGDAAGVATAEATRPPSIIALCDAAAYLTKTLLALGAENNLDDVVASRGRSWEAGKYRTSWLYLSRTDHGLREESLKKANAEGWQTLFKAGIKQTFFYHIPSYEPKNARRNYVARNAACAVLSLTGNCDQHAHVMATLLCAILPVGTPINICGMRMGGRDFPHTFVVVGNLGGGHLISLTKPGIKDLLVVDAWPTQGGAVRLEDFFVCEGALPAAQLIVDMRLMADGKDHLIKRVAKQKILYDVLAAEDECVEAGPSQSLLGHFLHHELVEQITYTQQIHRHRYLSTSLDEYDASMFAAPTVSSRYAPPTDSAAAYNYILECYPDPRLKRCVEYVQEKTHTMVKQDEHLDGDFTGRANAMIPGCS